MPEQITEQPSDTPLLDQSAELYKVENAAVKDKELYDSSWVDEPSDQLLEREYAAFEEHDAAVQASNEFGQQNADALYEEAVKLAKSSGVDVVEPTDNDTPENSA